MWGTRSRKQFTSSENGLLHSDRRDRILLLIKEEKNISILDSKTWKGRFTTKYFVSSIVLEERAQWMRFEETYALYTIQWKRQQIVLAHDFGNIAFVWQNTSSGRWQWILVLHHKKRHTLLFPRRETDTVIRTFQRSCPHVWHANNTLRVTTALGCVAGRGAAAARLSTEASLRRDKAHLDGITLSKEEITKLTQGPCERHSQQLSAEGSPGRSSFLFHSRSHSTK